VTAVTVVWSGSVFATETESREARMVSAGPLILKFKWTPSDLVMPAPRSRKARDLGHPVFMEEGGTRIFFSTESQRHRVRGERFHRRVTEPQRSSFTTESQRRAIGFSGRALF
jgi:hypothetical protein